MAEQKQKKKEHEETLVELEPVKAIEIETKNLVASSRIFIYTIIGLLAYLIFLVIPDISEKVTWMEKDLNSVLVQSERFKFSISTIRTIQEINQSIRKRQPMCDLSPKSRLSSS